MKSLSQSHILNFHRLLSLFFAFVLSLSLSAAIEEGGIGYILLSNGTVCVTTLNTGTYKGDVVVPKEIQHNGGTYKVTAIGSMAFASSKELTSVTLPEGIERIMSRAFYHCSQLTKVNLPESLEIMEVEAFSGCYNLTSITFPSKLDLIETKAFSDCTALTKVVIPKNVKIIGQSAFRDCFGLKELIIEEGVEKIMPYAFAGCHSLETVKLPKSMNDVGMNAFHACQNIRKITIPNGMVRKKAFAACPNIAEVKVDKPKDLELKRGPKGIYSFGGGVAVGNTKMDKVVISFSQGYQFNPYYYLGAGMGYYGRFKSDFFADTEVFIDNRFTLKKTHSPFLGMKVGFAAFNNQDWFLSPSIGYRMGLTRSIGLNLSLALDCVRKTDFDNLQVINRNHHYPRYWETNLTISVGVDL